MGPRGCHRRAVRQPVSGVSGAWIPAMSGPLVLLPALVAPGAILKWNGNAWSAQRSGEAVGLNGVWGVNAKDTRVVGGFGTILRANGSRDPGV